MYFLRQLFLLLFFPLALGPGGTGSKMAAALAEGVAVSSPSVCTRTALTPVIYDFNCQSWVTAIDVQMATQVAMGIKSDQGDSECKSLSGTTELAVIYQAKPGTISW